MNERRPPTEQKVGVRANDSRHRAPDLSRLAAGRVVTSQTDRQAEFDVLQDAKLSVQRRWQEVTSGRARWEARMSLRATGSGNCRPSWRDGPFGGGRCTEGRAAEQGRSTGRPRTAHGRSTGRTLAAVPGNTCQSAVPGTRSGVPEDRADASATAGQTSRHTNRQASWRPVEAPWIRASPPGQSIELLIRSTGLESWIETPSLDPSLRGPRQAHACRPSGLARDTPWRSC